MGEKRMSRILTGGAGVPLGRESETKPKKNSKKSNPVVGNTIARFAEEG